MLRSLELAGSPQELGRRHGQALGAEIRRMRRGLLAYLARLSLYAGALPLFGGLLLLSRRFLPYVPAHLKQELAAVAAGAQVSLGTILLINVADDLANNTPRCSALAVGEARTSDGAYLMGRNLDYPVFLDVLVPLQTLFLLEPHRGRPLASLAWPGYIGVCTGMNQAGVALAQLSAMSLDRTLKGMPAALRFRQGLQAGATAPEVARIVQSLPGTIGNNLMLCDPKEALVLELSARSGAWRRPNDGLLTTTNHYQSPAMQPIKGRFPPPPPGSVLSAEHFTEAYSAARNRRLQELAAGRRLNPSDIQKILADDGVANAGTAACTVFAPAEQTIWVAQGKNPPVSQGPFAAIKLWS
ncbi:MAG: C45 family autoproteolytic acyltransferase/hydrolase [Deltaproteobacteria bacterium]|nr:C45 family autoproteolytic acyltransferase/hydrolase [Deltaproteobacteria bacterium]